MNNNDALQEEKGPNNNSLKPTPQTARTQLVQSQVECHNFLQLFVLFLDESD